MKFIKYEHYICLISIFIKRKTKKVGLHFQRNLPRGKLVYIFYMLFPVFVPPTIRFRTVQIKVLHFCLHFLSRHNFLVINVYMYELIDFIFYDHIWYSNSLIFDITFWTHKKITFDLPRGKWIKKNKYF